MTVEALTKAEVRLVLKTVRDLLGLEYGSDDVAILHETYRTMLAADNELRFTDDKKENVKLSLLVVNEYYPFPTAQQKGMSWQIFSSILVLVNSGRMPPEVIYLESAEQAQEIAVLEQAEDDERAGAFWDRVTGVVPAIDASKIKKTLVVGGVLVGVGVTLYAYTLYTTNRAISR